MTIHTFKLGIPVMALLLLAACQSTTTTPTTYQGSAPASRTQDRQEVARVRTQLAAQYIRDGNLDAAKRQLETALEADSRYAPAYDMMGVLLRQEGSEINLKKADEYFRRAISLDGNFMQARNNYGVYLSQMNRLQDAVTQFEIAGAALGYEGRAASLENLGRTYLRLNQTKKAEEAFLRALDVNFNSAIARVELMDIFLAQKNTLAAKQVYDEITTLWGNQALPPRVLLQGIKLSIMQHNTVQQQRLSQQLLSLYPLSDEAKRLKAWLSNPKSEL